MATAGTARTTPPSQDALGDEKEEEELPPFFKLGTLVNVESRTWPGINKPGGVGRVTAVDLENRTIGVRYVLGGTEKGVDVEYVKEHKFEGDDNDSGGDGDSANVRSSGRSRRRSSSDDNVVKEKEQKSRRSKRAFRDASSQANKMKNDKLQTSTTKTKTKAGTKRKARDDVKVEKSSKKKKSVISKEPLSSIKKVVKKVPSIISKSKVMPIPSESLTDRDKTNDKGKKVKKSNKSNAISEKKKTKKELNDAKISVTREKRDEVRGKQAVHEKDNSTKKASGSRPTAKLISKTSEILTSKDKSIIKDKNTKKSNKSEFTERKKINEKVKNAKKSGAKPTDKTQATDKNIRKVSSRDGSVAQRQNINPSCVLQSVYKDIKTQANSFVQEMVGKNDSSLTPSSPESTASLEIKMESGREQEFNALFSAIMRQKMIDAIELKVLIEEVEKRSKDKPFTALEVNQHLDRLDKNNIVMVSSGSIYML